MNDYISVKDWAVMFSKTEDAEKGLSSMIRAGGWWAEAPRTALEYATWCFSANYDTYEENIFLETDVSWYPEFLLNGRKYVHATLFKHSSNLELYTIHLSGNDDYSIAKDYIGFDSAMEDWVNLKMQKFVRQEDLEGNYFSN